MVGKKDKMFFLFLEEDVFAHNGKIYTNTLPIQIRFNRELSDVLHHALDENDSCKQLQRASSAKWFCPLSDQQARMLLAWHEQDIQDDIGHC